MVVFGFTTARFVVVSECFFPPFASRGAGAVLRNGIVEKPNRRRESDADVFIRIHRRKRYWKNYSTHISYGCWWVHLVGAAMAVGFDNTLGKGSAPLRRLERFSGYGENNPIFRVSGAHPGFAVTNVLGAIVLYFSFFF